MADLALLKRVVTAIFEAADGAIISCWVDDPMDPKTWTLRPHPAATKEQFAAAQDACMKIDPTKMTPAADPFKQLEARVLALEVKAGSVKVPAVPTTTAKK